MKIFLTADAELPVPPKLYGGIERIIATLAEEYRAAGHEVALMAHAESTVEVDTFFPWPGQTSTEKGDSLKNALALQKAVSSFQPDILHSFSRLLWLLPLKLSHPSLPKIMSYQREPSGRTVSLSRKIHGDQVLCFTGCSGYIADNGKARGGGNWHAIPNFVRLSDYTFSPTVKEDAPLVFLSRIEKIKGTHNAIEIAQKSGRKLIIAGNISEGPEAEKYWAEQVEPHLDDDQITYVGPVDDRQKNELLGQAAAMVVPIEWNEPFGIVFAEALACGTPVISTPNGSLPSIVDHGVHGFLISSNEEGTECINQLKDLDRSKCRKKAEAYFTSEAVTSRYLSLYEERISAGKTS